MATEDGPRVCPDCGYVMSELDEVCLRCMLRKGEEEEKAAAQAAPAPQAAARPAAVAPPPGAPQAQPAAPAAPQRPVAQPAARPPYREEPIARKAADRPGEVTMVVGILFLSAIINIIGAFTQSGMLNTMPQMFISPDATPEFGNTLGFAFKLGLLLAGVNLLGKSIAGIALIKMLPWSRKAAIGIIIALFITGTIIKGTIVKTLISDVEQIQAAKAAKTARRVNEALGYRTDTPRSYAPENETTPPSTTGTGENPTGTTETPGATGTTGTETPGTQTPGTTGTQTPGTTGTETPGATGTTPAPSGEEEVAEAPEPAPAGNVGDAIYEQAMSMKPDLLEELKSSLSMGMLYITIGGLLLAAVLIYLLSMEHVSEAFDE